MTELLFLCGVSLVLGGMIVGPVTYALGTRHTCESFRKLMRPDRA